MGEANSKRRRREAFLGDNPWCCYCGGATRATTIDHVPSIQMFALRQRPKGLEVPACNACNQATKNHEQVAALLGRAYPNSPSQAERDEIKPIMQAVRNNIPGILQEMMPSYQQQFSKMRRSFSDDMAQALNVGPLLHRSIQIFGAKRSIQIFGAKIGLALYYATTREIIPIQGCVAVRWYSNFDALTGKIPADILEILGEPQTLSQGKKEVSCQFEYAFAITANAEMAAYFSSFRQSFAVLSLVYKETPPGTEGANVFRPGNLA